MEVILCEAIKVTSLYQYQAASCLLGLGGQLYKCKRQRGNAVA